MLRRHAYSHIDLLQQKRLNEDGEEIDSDAEDQEPTAVVPDKKKNSRLCSECCSRVAIRACNECGDKFCTKCYKFLHSTGMFRSTVHATALSASMCNISAARSFVSRLTRD
jgi:hypothetical protein